jgi:hypothetical protein
VSVEGYLGFGDLERLVHPKLSPVSCYQWAYTHHWKMAPLISWMNVEKWKHLCQSLGNSSLDRFHHKLPNQLRYATSKLNHREEDIAGCWQHQVAWAFTQNALAIDLRHVWLGVTERSEWEFGGRSLEIFCLFCASGSLGGKENENLEGQLPLSIPWGVVSCALKER